METTKTTTNHRARWAAIGAAVAVSLGAGGLGIAQATVDSGPMNIYQAIAPCRLADTRPAPDTVGTRTAPLGADETYTLDGWGAVGNCTLPTDIAALELNVTAIGATDPTFLTLFPAGGTRPTASNLNPVPGEPPTPNSVTVTLAADGKFSIYNLQGSVNVIVDVVGYYEDHNHTGEDIVDESLTSADVLDESLTSADVLDESLTGADVEDATLTGADIQNNSVSQVDTSNEAGIAFNSVTDPVVLTSNDVFVVRTRINVPSDGYVVALAELQWENDSGGLDRARCQLTKGDDTSITTSEPYLRLTDGGDTGAGLFYSDTHQRVFEVAAADDTGSILTGFGQNINLVCDETDGAVEVEYTTLTLQFFPTDYTAGGLVFIPFSIEEG